MEVVERTTEATLSAIHESLLQLGVTLGRMAARQDQMLVVSKKMTASLAPISTTTPTTKPSSSSLYSAVQGVGAGVPHADTVFTSVTPTRCSRHVLTGSELANEVITCVGGLSLFLELAMDSVNKVFEDDVLTTVGGVSLFLDLDMDYDADVLTSIGEPCMAGPIEVLAAPSFQPAVWDVEIADYILSHGDGLSFFLDANVCSGTNVLDANPPCKCRAYVPWNFTLVYEMLPWCRNGFSPGFSRWPLRSILNLIDNYGVAMQITSSELTTGEIGHKWDPINGLWSLLFVTAGPFLHLQEFKGSGAHTSTYILLALQEIPLLHWNAHFCIAWCGMLALLCRSLYAPVQHTLFSSFSMWYIGRLKCNAEQKVCQEILQLMTGSSAQSKVELSYLHALEKQVILLADVWTLELLAATVLFHVISIQQLNTIVMIWLIHVHKGLHKCCDSIILGACCSLKVVARNLQYMLALIGNIDLVLDYTSLRRAGVEIDSFSIHAGHFSIFLCQQLQSALNVGLEGAIEEGLVVSLSCTRVGSRLFIWSTPLLEAIAEWGIMLSMNNSQDYGYEFYFNQQSTLHCAKFEFLAWPSKCTLIPWDSGDVQHKASHASPIQSIGAVDLQIPWDPGIVTIHNAYVSRLDCKLELDGVEATSHCLGASNVFWGRYCHARYLARCGPGPQWPRAGDRGLVSLMDDNKRKQRQQKEGNRQIRTELGLLPFLPLSRPRPLSGGRSPQAAKFSGGRSPQAALSLSSRPGDRRRQRGVTLSRIFFTDLG